MKKRILGFILALIISLPCLFLFSSCNKNITDIAYVEFISAESDKKVLYYSNTFDQIYLVPSDSSSTNDYYLTISFSKYISPETIKGKQTFCVDIDNWSQMTISIKNSYWAENKKIYLNGKDITEKRILVDDPSSLTTDIKYRFEDFGLVKGNKNNYINTIEYK